MSAGTSAAIYTGTDTLESRWFEATGLGSSFGVNYWTVSSYVADDTEVSYTMTRNNDITNICADCYVFDPTDATLEIIMARGPGISFAGFNDYHGTSGDGNAAGYTLNAPTMQPTSSPSSSPDDSEDPTTTSQDIDNNSSAGKIQMGLMVVTGLFNFLWL